MAETSLPWANNGLGDGRAYIDDEWSDTWRKFFTIDRTLEGVIALYLNGLTVTNPAGLNISVATGAAIIDGKFYENSAANALLAVVDPGGGGTNYYTIVLRKTWGTQLVRLGYNGPDPGPGLHVHQTDGVVWEIPFAAVSVTGGAVTITDARHYCHHSTRVSSAMVDTDTLLPVNMDTSMKWCRIAETIVTVAAIVEFSSIPTTYNHLKLIITGRSSTGGSGWDSIDVTFNGDVGAHYQYMNYSVINSVPATVWAAAQTEIKAGVLLLDGLAAEKASSIEIDIFNYKNTTYDKILKCDSQPLPDIALSWGIAIDNGCWESVAAINKITLTPHTAPNTFAIGSIVSLYGII